MWKTRYVNPFRPGAGHMPPYLAGRKGEIQEFLKLLEQEVVLENMILTGLRGVGKTVLLDTLKPYAMDAGWLWVGTDLSEATTISESHICIRMLADLALVTSSVTLDKVEVPHMGFAAPEWRDRKYDYETMTQLFALTPGLSSDKLKAVLETAWFLLKALGIKGIVFAYDEAQNMQDHADKSEYPLSLMLDVFQSIQKKGVPFMLLLTGLPTLLPKMVEARTYSERMFHVVFVDRLSESESRDAIVKPVERLPSQAQMSDASVEAVIQDSGGYPYFIQFICREVYDVFLRRIDESDVAVPIDSVIRKLDTDFFAGRWAKASDRQRDLLKVIANLPGSDSEFTIQAAADLSMQMLDKPFSRSQISNMLSRLSEAGLVYKNRHGRYSFAVPLLGKFILRQDENAIDASK